MPLSTRAGTSVVLPCRWVNACPVRDDLPTGTVTFLFTDVEGSTRLLDELGAERYAEALEEHRRVMRGVFAQHGGVEVDTQGDACFVAFPTAPGALGAAADARAALAGARSGCRMGCIRGRRSRLGTAMSVWTSIGRPASRPRVMGARCWLGVRRGAGGRHRAPESWRAPAQGPDRAAVALPAWGWSHPAAQDPARDEPADPVDAARRPQP